MPKAPWGRPSRTDFWVEVQRFFVDEYRVVKKILTYAGRTVRLIDFWVEAEKYLRMNIGLLTK